jgi:ParB/RepB/Spo0J family partition protein
MPARQRPPVKSLFPGLERRAAEAREAPPVPEEAPAPAQESGRGRRAVLRSQEEIEQDLRALPEDEREAVLSSTYLVADQEALRDQIRYIDIAKVHPNPHQPRKQFDPARLDELAESIRAHGVLNPIQVQALPDGQYQIIAGERRWRAARKAGRTNIPAIVKSVDTRMALEIALLENLQREDLSPLEEAETYQTLLREFGLTQAALGARIGKKQAYISKMLALLELPASVQALMTPTLPPDIPRGIAAPAPLSAGAAYVLGRLPDSQAQEEVARRVVIEGLNVREVEQLVRDWRTDGSASEFMTETPAEEGDTGAPEAKEASAAPPAPAVSRAPRAPTVYPTTFTRPEPAGPQVRFADLSVFQLYREVGRITTVDLARLEDALRTDLAMIEVMRTNAEAESAAEATPEEEARRHTRR